MLLSVYFGDCGVALFVCLGGMFFSWVEFNFYISLYCGKKCSMRAGSFLLSSVVFRVLDFL